MKQRLVVGGLMFAVIACVAMRAPHTPSQKPLPVSISGFTFLPAELTVSVGDSVVWTNDDALLHTTSADSGAWSSPEMRRGERYVVVAARVGRFPYHCAAHPVMRGTLIIR